MANTFLMTTLRIPGTGAGTSQNLFTIENTSTTGTAVTMTLRRLLLQMDGTATIAQISPNIRLSRMAAAGTGGTAVSENATAATYASKGRFDATIVPSTYIVFRMAASTEGTASAITATPTGIIWQQIGTRLHSAVGQVVTVDLDMVPALCADNSLASFLIRPSEYLCVHLAYSTTTANPTTNMYTLSAVWEET